MSVTSVSPCVEQLEARRLFFQGGGLGEGWSDFQSFSLGNLNGDTKGDLAVVTKQGLRLSTGNGDGTFTAAQSVSLPARPLSVAGGDINNDGKGDLVAQMPKGIIAVLIGIKSTPGPGDLVAQPFFFDLGAELALKSTKNLDVQVADVNGDNKDDVVAVDNQRGIIGVLVSQFTGTETFTYGAVATSPFGPGGRLALGDANGDGLVDLADLSVRGSVDVSLNLGGFVWDDTDITHVVGGGRTAPANVVNRVATGDVNGDGRDEIVAIANSGVRVFFMSGDGEVEDVFNPNIGPLAPALQSRLSLADINGDGHDDLFAINGAGQTRFFDIFAELP